MLFLYIANSPGTFLDKWVWPDFYHKLLTEHNPRIILQNTVDIKNAAAKDKKMRTEHFVASKLLDYLYSLLDLHFETIDMALFPHSELINSNRKYFYENVSECFDIESPGIMDMKCTKEMEKRKTIGKGKTIMEY